MGHCKRRYDVLGSRRTSACFEIRSLFTLSAVILHSQKFKLKDELKRRESNGNTEKADISTECTICFNEFKEGDKLGWSENCRHFFHRDCVFQWLLKHKECPCCRRQFLPDEKSRSSPAVATEQTDVEMGSVEAVTSRTHEDAPSDLRSTNNARSAAFVEEEASA